ncbi:type II toxin-antitoxin system RelE/ParE family toxin [Cohnella caldifontis]|uniref:type II toxin-antitoxin system RelE/ParE family toxin n=1 Tax=Cohnella caldifontis TaxID=3027471 RepID=UPI0023ED9315|nr:type II toxin-antitoxin system RelE/ParE family toxin [Cohnella sp. YIM B05605]
MEEKLPIKYLPSAVQDLTDIVDYISIDNPTAAIQVINQIDESISILAHFPYSGVTPKVARLQLLNYRVLVVQNYLVFYVVETDFIEVRRILHAKRKYNFLF